MLSIDTRLNLRSQQFVNRKVSNTSEDQEQPKIKVLNKKRVHTQRK